MARLEIRPFVGDDVAAAAALLAARHRAQRAALRSLPERFGGVEAAGAAVEALWSTEGASGVLATSAGQAVGFLLGTRRDDDRWGPHVWVEPAGHAVLEAELVRDLYAAAAARWVDEGRTAHFTVVPATDAAVVDAWFRLGFGQQQVYALRELPIAPVAMPDDRLVIRRAVPEDAEQLAVIDLSLPQHQAASPVFNGRPVPAYEFALADVRDTIEDPAYAMFVAERDGALVGGAAGWSVELSELHSGLTRPGNAGLLGFAAVLPHARGYGIGRALGEAVLSWMAEAGYRTAVLDWRATNLPASRTWPRLGFEPSFLRLHRRVGY